ncbi:unnamed protein product [Pedinophyceae sp. YPF-701]|nr:unnamed protein product [Pedinophyceae sp. YPF-701]
MGPGTADRAVDSCGPGGPAAEPVARLDVGRVPEAAPAARDGAGAHGSAHELPRRIVIGAALTQKKINRYLTSDFIELAAARDLELRILDLSRPIEEQGPFDVLLHKLPSDGKWMQELDDYVQRHPHTRTVDDPAAIKSLACRSTMLQHIEGEEIIVEGPGGDGSRQRIRVRSPIQTQIPHGASVGDIIDIMRREGMQYPMIVKPLNAFGGQESHSIAVLQNEGALDDLINGPASAALPTPFILQEFIEHGGVMFKVYVVGESSLLACRPSLSRIDVGQCETCNDDPCTCLDPKATPSGLKIFTAVSRKPKNPEEYRLGSMRSGLGSLRASLLDPVEAVGASAAQVSADGGRAPEDPPASVCDSDLEEVRTVTANHDKDPEQLLSALGSRVAAPPPWFVQQLGQEVRRRVGLNLFNIDIIGTPRPTEPGPDGISRTFYVVDINYFPGYDKLDGWQTLLLDFLERVSRDADALAFDHADARAAPESAEANDCDATLRRACSSGLRGTVGMCADCGVQHRLGSRHGTPSQSRGGSMQREVPELASDEW